MNHGPALKLLFLTLVCSVALAVASRAPTNSETPAADDRQQLLDLEKEWVAAETKHDLATVRRILDDKFVFSYGAGKPQNKEAFLKQIGTGDIDPTESQTLSDWNAIIDVDTAVVVGTDTVQGTEKGAAYMMVYRYTATYIRRHGRWRALAEHLVEAPQAK